MTRFVTIMLVAMAVGASYGLYRLKHEVHLLEDQIALLDERIEKDQAALQVLRAEWAYLTRPQRLELLNMKHLRLVAPKPEQFIDLKELPDSGAAIIAEAEKEGRDR